MSTGITLITRPELPIEECSCYCQNIAAELGILTFLEEIHGCQLIASRLGDEGEASPFFLPDEVLGDVERLERLLPTMDEDEFEFGKQAFEQDLAEFKEALLIAKKAGVSVAVESG